MTFFDSADPFARPGLADLDRVYRFAWHEFTQAHWDRLDAVYTKLPGWMGYDPVPRWFGKGGRTSPHLTASVEPPGLQVTGLLPIAEFTEWHEAFMKAIADFPTGEPG
jgi:hypothetical protein